MDVRQMRWIFQKMLSANYLRYPVYALVICFYILHNDNIPKDGINANTLANLISPSTAFTALAILGCELLVRFISYVFQRNFEDSTKLTENYDQLVKRYNRVKLIEYEQVRFPGEAIAFRGKNSPLFRFEFNHAMKWNSYELPKQIKDRSSELMKAHDCSKIYNNINVRLEDCRQSGNIVRLIYSRTTYYDLLVTNRVMDYPLESEKWNTIKSVRQIYEPGPFLSPLSKSKLSNHLGFNGFVELFDGYVIFIRRSDNVSIGKRSWSASVNASYKTQYGLNDKREMSARYMGNAIRREIRDELKISIKKDESLEESIFAFYRDLVEGGKPHFVFYYKMKEPIWTKEFFEENFRREHQKRKDNSKRRTMSKEEKIKDDMIEDGDYFEFFSVDELRHSELKPDKMKTPDGRTLKMQSDGSIALALLLNHLATVKENMQTLLYSWFWKTIQVESDQTPPEKRLSSDEIGKLAKAMVNIFLERTTVEKEVALPNSFFNEEMLEKWMKTAEMKFKDILRK